MMTARHGDRRGTRIAGFVAITVLLSLLVVATGPRRAGAADNPIVTENAQPGTADWKIGVAPFNQAEDVNQQIKGYASQASIDLGETIDFKVTVNPAQSFSIEVFRLGWYQGLGARRMQAIGPLPGTSQPACPIDSVTGLIECHWSTSYSLTVPDTWTSGVYLARLTNAQNYQNYLQFVVRDDDRPADLLYQTSVATYQAYNNYPSDGSTQCASTVPVTGKDVYDNQSSSAPTLVGNRAVKVSFDRPYACSGAGDLTDPGWSWEPNFIRWMEKSGYDVTYSTDIDTHAHGERLLSHKGFVSGGHDEYWSKEQFDAAEAARDAGVHLGFFGGNEAYWQVRYEPSSDAVPNRIMVVYKNTPNNTYTTLDPIADPALKTVRFIDPPLNRPTQLLTGQSFGYSTERSISNAPYVPTATDHWVFDGSGFAPGDSTVGITGYEFDYVSCHYPLPQNTSFNILSTSPIADGDGYRRVSNSTIYRAPSGAWVFNSGTVAWSWALTDKVDPADPTGQRNLNDPRIQKATANVLDAFVGKSFPVPGPSNLPDCSYHKAMTFEAGTLNDAATGANKAVGNGISVNGATPITGNFSARFTNAAGAWLDEPMVAADDASVTFSIRLEALPTVDVRLAAFSSLVNDSVGNLVLVSGGGTPALEVRLGGTRIGVRSAPLTVGTTYTVRLRQQRGLGANGVMEGFLAPAGSPLGAAFAGTTTGSWTTRVDRVRIGSTANSAATPPLLNATIDDVVVDGAPIALSTDPPLAPTGLTANAGPANSVILHWTDNATDEAAFTVQRSTGGGAWTTLSSTVAANATTFSDTTAAPLTDYSYRVAASNANGSSAFSNVASLTTPDVAPNAPTNLVATQVAVGQVNLAWTDNATNEVSYVVERSQTSSFTTVNATTLPANSAAYQDTSAPDGFLYYRVKALAAGGSASAYSNVATGSRLEEVTFENGSLTGLAGADKIVGTGISASNVAPLKGSYSARIPLGTANAYAEETFPPVDELFADFYLRLDAQPTQDVRIAQVIHGTGGTAATAGTLWVRANGTLQLKNNNATIGSGPVLSIGTTYRIGLHQRKLSASTIQLEAFVATGDQPFGSPFASSSTAAFTSASGAGTFRVGSTLATGGLGATFDNVKLDSVVMPPPKVAPTLDVTAASVEFGTTMHAAAALTGANVPTGTITFNLYTDAACSTPLAGYVTEAVAPSPGGTAATTSGWRSPTARTLWWRATYSGDALNDSALSGCATASTAAPASVSVTGTTTDLVSGDVRTMTISALDNANQPIALQPGDLALTPSGTGAVTVGTTTTAAQGALQVDLTGTTPGSVSVVARIGGAAGTSSAPFAFDVVARQTALQYTGDTTAYVDGAPSVRATLTAQGNPVAGATIVFGIGAHNAAAVTNGAGVASALVPLDVQPPSTQTVNVSFDAATIASVSYASSSTTGSIDTDRHPTSLAATANPGTIVAANTPVTISATLSSDTDVSSEPIDLYLCPDATVPNGGNLNGCTSLGAATTDATGVASTTVTPNLDEGTYNIAATYDGDTTKKASASAPTAESALTVTFNVATPTLSLTASPVQFGETLHASALLSEAQSPTASVTFTLFSDTSCATPVAGYTPESVSLSPDGSGNFTAQTASGFRSHDAAPFAWKAQFAGDAANTAASSACVPVSVAPPVSVTIAGSTADLTSGATRVITISATKTGGQPITLAAADATVASSGNGAVSLGTLASNPDGSLSVVATGTLAGSVSVSAKVGGPNGTSGTPLEFVVVPRSTTLTYTGDTTAFVDGVPTLSATLTSNGSPVSGATVLFNVGSQAVSASTNASGVASTTLTLNVQPPGSLPIGASFNATTIGSIAYASAQTSSTLTTSKHPTSLSVTATPSSVSAGASVTMSATLTSGNPRNGHTVLFWQCPSGVVPNAGGPNGCVGVGSAVTNSSGVASTSYNVNALAGTYNIAATYGGSEINLPSTSTAGFASTITVTAAATSLALNVSGTGYHERLTLSATLRRTANNAAIPGATITFNHGGVAIACEAGSATTTNASGVATCLYTLPVTDHPGVRVTLGAAFATAAVGGISYQGSSGSSTIRIVKRDTSLTFAGYTAGSKNYTSTTVTLREANPTGAPITGATLTFTFLNNKNKSVGTFTGTTNASGVFTIGSRATPAGALSLRVNYATTTDYAASTATLVL